MRNKKNRETMKQNYYLYNFKQIFTTKNFYGWGRKKTGRCAQICHKIFGGDFTLLEDGFIRSLGLGVENSPAFSIVEDKLGIYYDATQESTLENILNTYDFATNPKLLKTAKKAIKYITKHEISKYNDSKPIPPNYFKSPFAKKILIIAQTFGDSSLKYGLADHISTNQILQDAKNENPDCEIYLKIHPDVLSGKKKSDINPKNLPQEINIITENFNPISLLKHFIKVYTKTSQMGFESLLVGCECICYGMPFYAGWGLTNDKQTCKRRQRKLSLDELFCGAYLLYSKYYNPIFNKKSDILDTLKTIKRYRYIKGDKKAFMFGFSAWKHDFIPPFMQEYKKENIIFINPFFKNHLQQAIKKGLNKDSKIFIWGKKEFKEIENFAKENHITPIRIEDGFIRSISLGSDLTRPYSQVFDTRGIYFDPTTSSDLENILNTQTFKKNLIKEAQILREKILNSKISKYNVNAHKTLKFPENKTKILVSGQVEDDASIKYGAPNQTNLSLLKQVKSENPNAYIIFKPHPDVLSGNRVGNIPTQIALQYCDEIITDASLSSCLQAVDEVHTLTSLSGFEALLYGKKVTTYGMPFYAGWGLTNDKQTCKRRQRKLSLDALIAGTYILYPRYIHPKTLQYCHPIVLIDSLIKEKEKLQNNKIYAFKKNLYAFLSRKAQKIYKILFFKI